jgi:hypothetical protein
VDFSKEELDLEEIFVLIFGCTKETAKQLAEGGLRKFSSKTGAELIEYEGFGYNELRKLRAIYCFFNMLIAEIKQEGGIA